MKAIVLEVKNGTSACLREDGTVVKVRGKHPVGQTIELNEGRIFKFKEALAGLKESGAADYIRNNAQKVAMAAAACICVLLGGGIYSYNNLMAASYMSVDVNPSLEYTLNRVNRVIDVKALNDDAEKIVEELKEAGIKHATVAETISETTRILEEEKYIAEDKDNIMLVGITGADKHKSGDIDTQVHTVADQEMTDRVSVYTFETSKKERKEAQKRGVSAGRYATAKAICDKNNVDMNTISDADFDELSHMSVASLVGEEEGYASGSAEEDKERKDEKADKKNGEKKDQKPEDKPAAAVSAPQPAQAQQAVTPVTAAASTPQPAQKEDSEEEDKKSDSKSDSSKKKKTASGDSAEKSRASVSSADADKKSASGTGSENASEAADATASGNTAEGSSNTGSAKTDTGTTVATVTTDDGVPLTVVVPDNSLIGAPQDTTVEEYEQSYKEIVTAVTQPSGTDTGTAASSGETAAVEAPSTETREETSTVVKADSTEKSEGGEQ